MQVRAIAHIGEDVLLAREGSLTEPGDAFRTHVTESRGTAVHPHHHEVATDTGLCAAAGRKARGAVVRAA